MARVQGLAMLIRSETSGFERDTAIAVISRAILPASRPTLPLGGLLLLIGP
jgi:hypothetical protein